MNVCLLPNAVEATDALLEQTRIGRQIEQYEVVRKLKVTTLRTDLGTDEETGPVFLREPGCVLVALQQAEFFVEHRRLRTDAFAQGRFDRLHGFAGVSDEKKLFLRLSLQQVD